MVVVVGSFIPLRRLWLCMDRFGEGAEALALAPMAEIACCHEGKATEFL
mgnify:CR=1 FL=1